MSYLDRQRVNGSYKGIEFFCVTHDQSGGRRIQKHQFPNRDKPYPEDLGREGEDISIKIICSGENYDLERNNLIKLFSSEGPGELIVPWLEATFVQHGKYSVRHSNKDGGYCEFTVNFTEMNNPSFPTSENTLENEINATSLMLLDESIIDFQDGYDTNSITAQVEESFDNLMTGIQDVYSVTSSAAASIFEASVFISQIKSDIRGVLTKPFILADQLSSSIASLQDAVDINDGDFSATRILNRSAKSPFEQVHDQIFKSKEQKQNRVQFETTSSINAKVIEDKLDNYISLQLIGNEAQFLSENPTYDFSSILEQIETQISITENDVIYTNLNDLKVSLIKLRDNQEPEVAPLDLKYAENALNLLYQRGYKLEEIDNFIFSNNISNPNLVGPREVV